MKNITVNKFANLIDDKNIVEIHDVCLGKSDEVSYIRRRDITRKVFRNCKFYNLRLIRIFVNDCVFDNCTFDNVNIAFISIGDTKFINSTYKNVKSFQSHINATVEGLDTLPYACPMKGDFYGYKICCTKENIGDEEKKEHVLKHDFSDLRLVKLLIPSNAKRSSAFSDHCRASKAMVTGIYNLDGSPCEDDTVYSAFYKKGIAYKLGDEVSVKNFNENRWSESTSGIHFNTSEESALSFIDEYYAILTNK